MQCSQGPGQNAKLLKGARECKLWLMHGCVIYIKTCQENCVKNEMQFKDKSAYLFGTYCRNSFMIVG